MPHSLTSSRTHLKLPKIYKPVAESVSVFTHHHNMPTYSFEKLETFLFLMKV